MSKKETLHEIGLRCGTDKATFHNYCVVYDEYLAPLRNKKVKVLEVGAYLGDSVDMWAEYFTKGSAIGIEPTDEWFKICNQGKPDNAHFIQGDGCDPNLINRLIDKYGSNFDFIIEDASHHMKEQQIHFGLLFKHVKPGGYYSIEDLQTARISGPAWGTDGPSNTLDMLISLRDTGKFSSPYISTEDTQEIIDTVESVDIIGR